MLTVLTMLLTVGIVQGQQEYNYSAGTDFTPRDIFGNYYEQYSPRVACSSDGSHCAALVFNDNSAFGRGLKLYYTTSGFSETDWLGFPNTEKYTFSNSEYSYRDNSADSAGALNITREVGYNFPLGYDIWYDSSTQQYYILMATRSGQGDNDGASCSKYTFQAGRSPEIQGPSGCGGNREWTGGVGAFDEFGPPLGIHKKDTNDPTYTMLYGWCGSSILATCSGHILVQEYYLKNNTFIGSYQIAGPSCITNSHPQYGDMRFYAFAGIMSEDITQQKRDIRWSYGCGSQSARCGYGSCAGAGSSSMGSFPTTEVGYNYYNNPLLYYLRDDYSNSTSIWRTQTTDYNSYSDTALYYLMNASEGEYINASSEWTTTSSQWVYEYKSFDTNNLTRSVAYDVELFPIEITARYFTPNVDYILLEPASITVNLNCPSGFSTTDTGDEFTLGSQCQDDVELIMDTGLYRPTHAENTIDIPEGCDDYLVRYYLLSGTYTVPVEVRNQLTGELLTGVDVYVGSESNTTDAEGIAYINVQPLSGAFLKETQTACRSELEPYGTPKTYTITAEHSDYLDFETQDEFAYIDDTNETRYLPIYQIYMTPDAAIVETHIRTQDGVEITPQNTRMTTYGADNTWIIIDTASFNVNYATEFPATFLFQDNRSSFPVNFTYDYFGTIYMENKTVTKGTSGTFYFDLPFTSYNSSCLTSDDCLPSFCQDDTFAQLIGCNIPEGQTQGKCEYSYEVCQQCDPEVGCYDLPTTTPCSDHMDCLNLSYCIGNSKSRTGLCGSQGYCLYKDIICTSPDFCDSDLTLPTNQTTGMCRQTFLCVLTGGIREKFTIRVPTNNLEYTLTGEPWKDVVDVEYVCDVESAGTQTCIDGYTVSEAEAEVGVATFPENWAYNVNQTTGVEFYDIAVSCSDGCNISYEYCPHGCAGGACLTAPLSPEAGARNFIQAMQTWWVTMFPTIWDQAFMWTIISLLSSLGIAGGLGFVMRGGSGNGFGGQEIGSVYLGSAIAFFLLGSFIGAMPLFIGVVFSILAGFLVWKLWK